MENDGSSSATQDIHDQNTSRLQSTWFHRRWEKLETVTKRVSKYIVKNFASTNHKIELIDDVSFIEKLNDNYNDAKNEARGYEDRHFEELVYALVRSVDVDDVQRGIQLLEDDLLRNSGNSTADKLYYVAIGYYRLEDYKKCEEHLKSCKMISPSHEKALNLLNEVETRIKRGKIFRAACGTFGCCGVIWGTAVNREHFSTPAICCAGCTAITCCGVTWGPLTAREHPS